MNENLSQLLSFIELLDEFKYIKRIIHHPKNLRNKENDAEHSWHIAMIVLLFSSEFPDINVEKALKIAIIHDIAEIYAGDTPIFDYEKEKSKTERERAAVNRILKHLPSSQSKEFALLLGEYNNRSSKEARFVYEIDKVQPFIMAVLAKGWHMKKYKLEKDKYLERVYSRLSEEFGFKTIIKRYAEIAENKGYFYVK